jgi:hypothetical protein
LIAWRRGSACYDEKGGALTRCNRLIHWLSGNRRGNRWIGMTFGGTARASNANACTNSNYEESAYFKRSCCLPCHKSRGWLGTILSSRFRLRRAGADRNSTGVPIVKTFLGIFELYTSNLRMYGLVFSLTFGNSV